MTASDSLAGGIADHLEGTRAVEELSEAEKQRHCVYCLNESHSNHLQRRSGTLLDASLQRQGLARAPRRTLASTKEHLAMTSPYKDFNTQIFESFI